MKFLVTTLMLLSLNGFAQQEQTIEEVFVVPEGFDSNDEVEATVHALLPSGCFRAKDINVKRSGSSFQIKFYIEDRMLPSCQENSIQTPINYTQTISIGSLAKGQYTFTYQSESGSVTKSFSVSEPRATTLDDAFYAPISSAFVPELTYTNRRVRVVLTGMYYSNCYQLKDENIEIKQYGNVFVILPRVDLVERSLCDQQEYPLQNIVMLPKLTEEGHYFIHIRSQSGLSVNKVFHLKEDMGNPGSRR